MLYYWMTAVIHLSVQMFKYPNIWMFQNAAKSLPNLKICDFLSTFGKKVAMLLFSNIRWPIRTIHQLTSYFPGRSWESETRPANCAISLVKLSPKYPSTHWKWEFGMILMKNNYGTKLREALPNRHQIHSK